MPVVRWRLADFLEQRQLTAYALSKVSGIHRMSTIYRIARRGDEPVRVDLPTLAAIVTGLRLLTKEDVQLTDILEYEANESGERVETKMQSILSDKQTTIDIALEQLRQLNLTEAQLATLLRQLQTQ
jgi:DNA-binding Xre family transcriptional regulator